MKSQWFTAGVVAAAFAASTVAFGQVPTPTQSPRGNQTQAPTHDPQMTHEDHKSGGDQRRFVEHMLAANFAEAQLGQLAAARASSSEVKSFAEKMVSDHTKANDELKPIAQQFGLSAPMTLDSKHQKLADKLAKLQGADFDREYMKAMVEGHKNVLSEVSRVAGKTSNEAAKGTTIATEHGSERPTGTTGSSIATAQAVEHWAATAQPIVGEHLQRAEEILKTITQK